MFFSRHGKSALVCFSNSSRRVFRARDRLDNFNTALREQRDWKRSDWVAGGGPGVIGKHCGLVSVHTWKYTELGDDTYPRELEMV